MTIGLEEKDQCEDELHHHWTEAESRQQQLGDGDGGVSEATTKNVETYEGWEDVQSDPFRHQDTAGSHHVPAYQSYNEQTQQRHHPEASEWDADRRTPPTGLTLIFSSLFFSVISIWSLFESCYY